LFGKREICLGNIHIVTSKDLGACGIEDLNAPGVGVGPDVGLAVHAVKVESSSGAREVEPVELGRDIDGGKTFIRSLTSAGNSQTIGGECDNDVLTGEVSGALIPDVDLVLGIVIEEDVCQSVLGERNSSHDDLAGGGGGGAGDMSGEVPVYLLEGASAEERAGVVHGIRPGNLHHGRPEPTVNCPRHGVIGVIVADRVGRVSIERVVGGVPDILRVVLRGREGGGDKSEEAKHVCKLVSKDRLRV